MELRLQTGDKKKEEYKCNFLIVCGDERGEEILEKGYSTFATDAEGAITETKSGTLLNEVADHDKLFKCFEAGIKPTSTECTASGRYFYFCQGDMLSAQYVRECNKIIDAMNIERNPQDKTLRNMLMFGMAEKELFDECLKIPIKVLDSAKVLAIEAEIQARNVFKADIASFTSATLPLTGMQKGATSDKDAQVNALKAKKRKEGKSSSDRKPFKKKCRWCLGPQWCEKEKCPA